MGSKYDSGRCVTSLRVGTEGSQVDMRVPYGIQTHPKGQTLPCGYGLRVGGEEEVAACSAAGQRSLFNPRT